MEDFSSDTNSTPKYKQYNPYKDLNTNSPYIKLYNLPTSPEYLLEQDSFRTRRQWGENLTFYTGSFYLTGALLGGAKGTLQGLSAAEYGDSFKIRLNRVLNAGGLAGQRLGNAAGVVGLMYAGMDSMVAYKRGNDDVLGSVLAGLGTGFLYRLTSGLRSAAVAGILGGIAAGAVVSGKQLFRKYVPN